MSLAPEPPRSSAAPFTATQWTALAFVYWVLLMGALTPGNIASGLAAGVRPDWPREALRLTAAGLLGASVTPLLLALARRFPPVGPRRARNLAVQAFGVAGLAPGLVLVSCLLAAWAFDGRLLPSARQVESQLLADTLLLVVCLALLLAILQVAPRMAAVRRPVPTGWAERLTVGERGRLRVIELSSVDWIETQGNYQALHCGGEVCLYRDTSKSLAAKLDPRRFVRIHRRFIVAADRVRSVEPLANGDAMVRLVDGVELRQSRHHRDALRAHLTGQTSQ